VGFERLELPCTGEEAALIGVWLEIDDHDARDDRLGELHWKSRRISKEKTRLARGALSSTPPTGPFALARARVARWDLDLLALRARREPQTIGGRTERASRPREEKRARCGSPSAGTSGYDRRR
jgi:hypothetical protein